MRLSLGSLKQPVDDFQEAVGVARIHPGEDAVEVTADHLGHLLHRLDFGALHVGAPGVQEPGDDGGLLAAEDVAQLFAIVLVACNK